MPNFSKSSQAWKDRLKHWAYTWTFVAFLKGLLLAFFLFHLWCNFWLATWILVELMCTSLLPYNTDEGGHIYVLFPKPMAVTGKKHKYVHMVSRRVYFIFLNIVKHAVTPILWICKQLPMHSLMYRQQQHQLVCKNVTGFSLVGHGHCHCTALSITWT